MRAKPWQSAWKARFEHVQSLNVERKHRLSMGVVLLAAFFSSFGCYFWILYRPSDTQISFKENVLTPHDELFAVDVRESGRGWAVGKYGLILRTDDGGQSWRAQKAGTTKTLTGVSFTDEQHGFAVGSGGIVLATVDGGLFWRAQNSGTQNQLLSVQALNPADGYAVGAFGTFLSTSNGGATWRKHQFSWDSLISSLIKQIGYVEPNLNGLYFVRPGVGWLVGEFGMVLHTRDGGRTWTVQRYGKDLPELFAVKFLDEHTGFAVGQQGAFIKTEDGGKNWVETRIGTKGLYGVALSGKRGVIVGDGVAWKTNDGGLYWAQSKSFPQHLWFSGIAIRGNKASVLGQAGTLLLFDLEKETATPLDHGRINS